MMMSEAKALELGLPILARIRAFASVGVDPALMGIAPVHATRRCLERAGWRLDDVDLIEANEAFAAQAISVGRVLEWDERRVNVKRRRDRPRPPHRRLRLPDSGVAGA